METEPKIDYTSGPRNLAVALQYFLGVITLVYGLYDLVSTAQFMRGASHTQGIVKYTEHVTLRSSIAEVDFQVNGEPFYCFDSLATIRFLNAGDAVSVYFDPSHPLNARTGPLFWVWVPSVGWTLLGLGMLIAGFSQQRINKALDD